MGTGRLGELCRFREVFGAAAGELDGVNVEPPPLELQARFRLAGEQAVARHHLRHDEARAEAVREGGGWRNGQSLMPDMGARRARRGRATCPTKRASMEAAGDSVVGLPILFTVAAKLATRS